MNKEMRRQRLRETKKQGGKETQILRARGKEKERKKREKEKKDGKATRKKTFLSDR
jgi:hypothetical protein